MVFVGSYTLAGQRRSDNESRDMKGVAFELALIRGSLMRLRGELRKGPILPEE